jgi:hypothetical protein
MRRTFLWLAILALVPASQAGDISSAEANLKRVQALVEAGAAPRSVLKAAEDELRDARNREILRRTLYSGNVTGKDVPEMLRAASELRERAAENLAAQRKLAEAGVIPVNSLEKWMQEQAFAEQQWDLAQSRARLAEELAEMARREAELQERGKAEMAILSEGKGTLSDQDFFRLQAAYFRRFSRPLPVSARGETPVHRSLGFDHRDRFDVALNPDEEEGRWLIRLLKQLRVPYIAFRRAIAGKATGAHIHIGLPSPRL